MKNRTYLSTLAGLMTATALLNSGCDGAEPRLEEKEITISEFKALPEKNFGGSSDFGMIAKSHDGKNVYVTVSGNGKLYHANSANLDAVWKDIALAPPGFDGSAGKAKLESAHTVRELSPGKDGVMVSVTGKDDPTMPGFPFDSGTFYLKGGAHEVAFSATTTDVDSTPDGTPGDKLVVNSPLTGLLVSTAKGDVPYIFGINYDDTVAAVGGGGGLRYSAMTKADLSPAKASAQVKLDGSAMKKIPKIAAGGDYLFAISKLGVTTSPSADIGTAKNFKAIANNTAANNDGVVGSDAFKMKSDVNNRDVTAVVVSNNYLFIALQSTGSFTGGVAVYEIKPSGTAPQVNAPDLAWNSIDVLGLAKDDQGKVWAVTANNLIEAKVDGKKGAGFLDDKDEADTESFETAKDGFVKESMPREGYKGAVFVNNLPVIATSKGLFAAKPTQKKVRGTKVVEKEKQE